MGMLKWCSVGKREGCCAVVSNVVRMEFVWCVMGFLLCVLGWCCEGDAYNGEMCGLWWLCCVLHVWDLCGVIWILDRVLWSVECFARGLDLGSVYSAVKVFLLNEVCRIGCSVRLSLSFRNLHRIALLMPLSTWYPFYVHERLILWPFVSIVLRAQSNPIWVPFCINPPIAFSTIHLLDVYSCCSESRSLSVKGLMILPQLA